MILLSSHEFVLCKIRLIELNKSMRIMKYENVIIMEDEERIINQVNYENVEHEIVIIKIAHE